MEDLAAVLLGVVLLESVERGQQLGQVLLDEKAGGGLALPGEARQRDVAVNGAFTQPVWLE